MESGRSRRRTSAAQLNTACRFKEFRRLWVLTNGQLPEIIAHHTFIAYPNGRVKVGDAEGSFCVFVDFLRTEISLLDTFRRPCLTHKRLFTPVADIFNGRRDVRSMRPGSPL